MPDERITSQKRQIVIDRAKGNCEYCQSQADFATQSFSVEHIIPLSRDGSNSLDNLALSCPGCNAHKYTKIGSPDPIDGSIVPLFHPRRHIWSDHFSWNDDFTIIIGLTPGGRATVEALKLNRIGLINLRRALFLMGEHPPGI